MKQSVTRESELARGVICTGAMSRAAFLAAAVLAGCSASTPDEGDPASCSGAKCDGWEEGESLCAAVRGNGPLVAAHWSSLARVIEELGAPAGIAGGSSGSITSFLYESVMANAAIRVCGGGPCTAEQRDARTALLVKSFLGYVGALTQTEEALAIQNLVPLAQRVREAGLAELAEQDIVAARNALETLLRSPDVAPLISPAFLQLLASSPAPAFHVRDLIEAVSTLGQFSVDDDRIFVRPGVIDFDAVAEVLGRTGNFYAGYGPLDNEKLAAWLDRWADATAGKSWPEIAATVPAAAEQLGAMVFEARALHQQGKTPSRRRLDEPVGAHLRTLVVTSVLSGDAVAAVEQARAQYHAGAMPDLQVRWDDVSFGYFGSRGDDKKVAEDRLGFGDAKTAKAMPLGPSSWRRVLALSPAEPGLAPIKPIDDKLLSGGGWSDLHPVIALEQIGCGKVVYITRQGTDSKFAEGVARAFGMTETHRRELYDLSPGSDSSFALALREADAVWCTNWDSFTPSQSVELSVHAYSAPMQVNNPELASYENATQSLTTPGCIAP